MRSPFFDFVRLVVDGNIDEVSRRLTGNPAMATTAAPIGATRRYATAFFFEEIAHYVHEGDTALHMAAAAWRRDVATLLVARGASCNATNRRGAQPLHYAADTNRWDPTAQGETIQYLLSVGADPNAPDANGVTPLHRAIRTRSFAAVRALLDGGADPRQPTNRGSRPLHSAVQTTGRAGSGTEHAREQQAAIIKLLLERGATVSDTDGRGRTVSETLMNEWSRAMLRDAIAAQP